MTVVRVAKRRRYTVISRETLNDERLSFRARGVLAWLLDKPDDWRCDSDQIAAAGKEGRDAIRAALKELAAAGYLRRERVQAPSGMWRTSTTVHESPTPENPSSVSQSPTPENPSSVPTPGNPTVGFPGPIPSSLTVTEDCERPSRKKNTTARDADPPGFSDWYAQYPRKEGREGARRAYVAALKSKSVSVEDLVLALKRQLPELNARERQFIPMPATWLNQQRWLDESASTKPKKPPRILNGAVMDEMAYA